MAFRNLFRDLRDKIFNFFFLTLKYNNNQTGNFEGFTYRIDYNGPKYWFFSVFYASWSRDLNTIPFSRSQKIFMWLSFHCLLAGCHLAFWKNIFTLHTKFCLHSCTHDSASVWALLINLIFSMFLKQLAEKLTHWAEVTLETCRRNKNQIQFPPFLFWWWIHCGKYLFCGEAMSKYYSCLS